MADGDIEEKGVLGEVGKAAEKATKSVDSLSSSIEKFLKTGTKARDVAETIGGVSTATEDFVGVIGSTNRALSTAISTLGTFAQATGLIDESGPFKGILKSSTDLIEGFGKLAEESIKFGKEILDLADAPSKAMRDVERSLFDIGKRFGESSDETDKFAESLFLVTSTPFARSMNLSGAELKNFMEAAKSSNLTLKQLNETVDVGVGTTNLYVAATAFSSASGLGLSTTVDSLNRSMNIQGKTAQEAVQTLGMYYNVSQETGLSISKIVSSLDSATNGFQKLGLTADFGRPVLESFARTVKDLGLGIEQSTDLTQTFTSALGNMMTNYGNAYLLVQRGGLNLGGLGGGGLLGSSIGLQAQALEAEKTGEQSDLARRMTSALKETLTSFTGGQVITVQEAARSPQLQTQFYAQQQLLMNQFGIGDQQSANRVLDMLSKLDEATRVGDKSTKQALEESLKNEMDSRDKTLNNSEKLNRMVESLVNISNVTYRDTFATGREQATYLRSLAETAIKSGDSLFEKRKTAGEAGEEARIAALSEAEQNLKDIKQQEGTLQEVARKAATPARVPAPIQPTVRLSADGKPVETVSGSSPEQKIIIHIEMSEEARKLVSASTAVQRDAATAATGTASLRTSASP